MSWDILVQDLPAVATIADIPDDFNPGMLGVRSDLIRRILEVIPVVDFSDPAWGALDADDFSIEFNIGEDEDVESMMFHVHGGAAAGACIADIIRHLGVRAIDTATGEFFDCDSPELGFDQWRAYRDRVLRGTNSEC